MQRICRSWTWDTDPLVWARTKGLWIPFLPNIRVGNCQLGQKKVADERWEGYAEIEPPSMDREQIE